METMNIALPESMKQFVQERVSEGGYSSVSEYVRELIRADQKRKAEDRIDALLLEGLDSGADPGHEGVLGGEKTQVGAAARQSDPPAMTPRYSVLPSADRDLDGRPDT